MAADPAFVDTNVLVYASQAGTARHARALALLRRADAAGARLWVSRQVLREYLAVVTRLQPGAAAVPVVQAAADVRRFAASFAVAEDGPGVTERLLDLLERFPTGGRQVHDANIVATMLVHGVGRLLTFNGGDFRRFAGLVAVEDG